MLSGCGPSCLSVPSSLRPCGARRKQFKFGVELLLAELGDVPLVNAALFVKVRLLKGGNFVGVSHTAPVVGHRVVWKQEFNFVCRIGCDPETGVLDACLCRVSVRKEAKGGKSYEKLGFADVNLSSFAGSGTEGKKQYFLLEGYTGERSRRQDNSRLRLNVALKLLTADTCFKVPTDAAAASSSSGAGALLNPVERRAPHAPSTRSSVTDLGSQANLLTGANASSSSAATSAAAAAACGQQQQHRRESDAASCSGSGSRHVANAAAAACCQFDSDPLEQGSMASSLASSVAYRGGRYGDYANVSLHTADLPVGRPPPPTLQADGAQHERIKWPAVDGAYYNSSSGYATTGRASASTTSSAAAAAVGGGGSAFCSANPFHNRYSSAESAQSAAAAGGRLSSASTPMKEGCWHVQQGAGRAAAADEAGFQTLPPAVGRSRRAAATRVDNARVIDDLLDGDLRQQLGQHDELAEHSAGDLTLTPSASSTMAAAAAPDAHINRFLEDIIRNADGSAPGRSDGGGLALYVKRDEGVAAVVAPGPGFERVTMPRERGAP